MGFQWLGQIDRKEDTSFSRMSEGLSQRILQQGEDKDRAKAQFLKESMLQKQRDKAAMDRQIISSKVTLAKDKQEQANKNRTYFTNIWTQISNLSDDKYKATVESDSGAQVIKAMQEHVPELFDENGEIVRMRTEPSKEDKVALQHALQVDKIKLESGQALTTKDKVSTVVAVAKAMDGIYLGGGSEKQMEIANAMLGQAMLSLSTNILGVTTAADELRAGKITSEQFLERTVKDSSPKADKFAPLGGREDLVEEDWFMEKK